MQSERMVTECHVHLSTLMSEDFFLFREYRVRRLGQAFNHGVANPEANPLIHRVVNKAYFEVCSIGVFPMVHHELIGTHQNGRACRQTKCYLSIAIASTIIHLNNN